MVVGQLGSIFFDMNIVCLIQARMSSTRLPGKVLMNLRDKPVIAHIISSMRGSTLINKIVVVTTTNPQDDILVEYLKKNNYEFFRGSENDVLDRYITASEKYKADVVVRITADCPLVDSDIVDSIIKMAIEKKADYVSNGIKRTFPDGYDVEVISYPILKKIQSLTQDPSDKEHVTRYILNNQKKFTCLNFEAPANACHPEWRLTLDTIEDFALIEKIFDSFPVNYQIKYNDVLNFLTNKPELISINASLSLYGNTNKNEK